MILVTGATGNIGTEAVRLLAARGVPTRALIRDAARVPRDGGWDGVEIAVGDFGRPDSLDAALAGVDTLLLITPSILAAEIAAIDSAVRQGVGHVIKITNHKATENSPVDRRRDHARIEAHLAASGPAYTLLAPNLFMQNLLYTAPAVRETHGFVMSTGDGRFGMVDARDVAAAAAAVAAAPAAHAGCTYLLTGPRLITYADVATELSHVLGHRIEYRRLTPEQHRKDMVLAGVPEPVATSNAQVFGLIAEGDAAWLSDDITTLTGAGARDLRAFLADHAAAFRPSAA
ncbi:NmrA family NAD(P)-binding protein [Streptomyces sp. 8L]|uniref:NmrA family NAD(P)-binding protein n=1 Tax=Streptomyces sp. 8L TaxID=2877242 RepID=UPI001CD2BE4C|nr:NmrA family NAD(P)-binding protein [Streptomyces sp. 8L]MCA1223928.1 NmrA family NAD(P)-binding protein [Streptomyces sp. 8L]